MAIQVIKQGILPENRKFKGSCNNCKCEIICSYNDGKYSNSQRDGSYLIVKCPTTGCTAEICALEEIAEVPFLQSNTRPKELRDSSGKLREACHKCNGTGAGAIGPCPSCEGSGFH